MLDTRLCDLMCNCINFIEEETLIHTQARNMGDYPNHITLNQTPSLHPYLAIEGIEYYWGCAYNFYR